MTIPHLNVVEDSIKLLETISYFEIKLLKFIPDVKLILKSTLDLWLLGFEPRSPRPQRGILTTKLQPQGYLTRFQLNNSTRVQTSHVLYTPGSKEREGMAMAEPTAAAMPTVHTATTMESSLLVDGGERSNINEQPRWFTPTR